MSKRDNGIYKGDSFMQKGVRDVERWLFEDGIGMCINVLTTTSNTDDRKTTHNDTLVMIINNYKLFVIVSAVNCHSSS